MVGQVAGSQLAEVMEEALIARWIPRLERAHAVFTVQACEASVFASRARVELAEFNLRTARVESYRRQEK